MSGELAGALRHRVTVFRQDASRDALGGAGDWIEVEAPWAALAADGIGAVAAADARDAPVRMAATLRAGADVRVGDRLRWAGRDFVVRSLWADPALRDRMIARIEEQR